METFGSGQYDDKSSMCVAEVKMAGGNLTTLHDCYVIISWEKGWLAY
jgi:hypothetical protein